VSGSCKEEEEEETKKPLWVIGHKFVIEPEDPAEQKRVWIPIAQLNNAPKSLIFFLSKFHRNLQIGGEKQTAGEQRVPFRWLRRRPDNVVS
jgi:hypothetical protein